MEKVRSLRVMAASVFGCLIVLSTACAAAADLIPLRIGMGLPKPPYIMEPGGGGIDHDIADTALTRAGYKMVPLQFPQARARALMAADQLDGILSITEGIGGKGFFSENYVTYQNVAITLAENISSITKVADLAGFSVAGYQNAHLILGDQYKAITSNHPRYTEHANQIIQNRLLFTGRVDVVISDRSIFDYFTTELGSQINATKPLAYHAIFPPTMRQAVFRDPTVRDRFNAALKTMQLDGSHAAIYRKYNTLIKDMPAGRSVTQ